MTKCFLLLSLLSLFACEGCEEEEIWTTLPPETQTGAQTFGCMIDDKLFVGNNRAGLLSRPAFVAGYERDTDRLYIAVEGLIDYIDAGRIYITINHPTQTGIQEIEQLGYYPSTNISSYLAYNAIANEEVFLTRFDTINKIVSGRFQFTGRCVDSIKHITQGRFDLKINF